MNLKQLAEKKEYATDKDTTHTYLEVYDELFAPYQSKTVNILEIGNNGGGSIDLWCDYFDDAQIYGLEINELECLHKMDAERENVHITTGIDAYTHNAINRFWREDIRFDIIIDDGSHLPVHQLFVLTDWAPMLKKEGLIVIEDIQRFDILDILLTNGKLQVDDRAVVFDRRHIKKRFDDIILAINRG